MRKTFIIFISLIACLFMASPTLAQTATQPAGSGNEGDPYQIATLGKPLLDRGR